MTYQTNAHDAECVKLFNHLIFDTFAIRIGQAVRIHWDEIFRITGYRFDYRISVVTVLEFDFEHGEYLELQSDTPGFDQVLLAIIKRFQILPQMIDQLNGMSHGDEPIELWSKIKA